MAINSKSQNPQRPLEVLLDNKWHWFRVCIIAFIAIWISHAIESTDPVLWLRYNLFQAFHTILPSRTPSVNTCILLVDDQTFYEKLKGQTPINRRFLGALVRSVAHYEPAVIAVDFDLRSIDPSTKTEENVDGDTLALLTAIRDTSKTTQMVLPATINRNEEGQYFEELDIYDGFDFEDTKGYVSRGYIALPNDMRRLPQPITLQNGIDQDSFAIAIVRARFPKLCNEFRFGRQMYSTFVSENRLATISVADLATSKTSPHLTKAMSAKLRNNIVVLGGGWHDRAIGRGSLVDMHMTPVGDMHGALVHAQYAEALMSGRVFFPIKPSFLLLIELLLTFVIAATLKYPMPRMKKSGLVTIYCVLPSCISYIGFVNFGVYFDLAIVTFVLLIHILVEQILQWREDSHELASMKNKEHHL